jgi:hypothetical protein
VFGSPISAAASGRFNGRVYAQLGLVYESPASFTFEALSTRVQCNTALVDADGFPVACSGCNPPASESCLV